MAEAASDVLIVSFFHSKHIGTETKWKVQHALVKRQETHRAEKKKKKADKCCTSRLHSINEFLHHIESNHIQLGH